MAEQIQPLVYSINGARAALGGMSRSTFYERVAAGHFRIFHDYGRALVDAEEVRAYVAQLKSQTCR